MMGKDYWKRRLIKLLFGLLAIILSIGSWTPILKADSDPAKERYIVHLTPQSDPVQWSYKKGISSHLLKKVDANSRTLVLQLNADEVRKMQLDAEVTLIEKDYTFQLFAEDGHQTINQATYGFEMKPSQQFETAPWGITATQAVYAHQKGIAGQGIKIAVLDTGVDSSHPDLRIAGGYSFVEGEETYEDQHGHGTHVAGIINALPNGYGVIGMAPEAEVYTLKVMDTSGMGYYSSVIQAIEWCIQNEIQIVSMSFGGMEDSEILHQVIQEAATEHGILFVAAAGNNGAGVETETYPARYSEVLSVGAVNESNQQSSFSSAGNELDIVAPGEQIWSTTVHGEYGLRSGTSMATPYVAGAAALIWASDPGLRADQVRAQLVNQALPLGDSHHYGAGLVQVGSNQKHPELLFSPSSSSLKGKQNLEAQKLLGNFLNLQKKAIKQEKVQLGKDIYTAYNQFKIDLNILKQYSKNLSEGNSSTVENSVYAYPSVTQSIYEYFVPGSSYIESQENSLDQLIIKYQEKLDQFMLLTSDKMTTSVMKTNDWSELYWNVTGDGQSIKPGDGALVSFESATNFQYINVKITGPDYYSEEVVGYDYETGAGYYPAYIWYTSPSTPTGEYTITMTCNFPESTLDITFTIYVVQPYNPIYLNTSQHFNLFSGDSSAYMYRSGNQFETVTIRTEFLEEYDPYSDTLLHVYYDENRAEQIAYNDDYDDSYLSSVTLVLKPNSTIYIVCSAYSASDINANLGIYQIPNNFIDLPVDTSLDLYYPYFSAGFVSFVPTYSATYTIFTGPYGGAGLSNDTVLYLYSDNMLSQRLAMDNDGAGNLFSKINIELNAGTKYYLALSGGSQENHFRARLTIQMKDLTPPTTPINFSVIKQNVNSVNLRWDASSDNVGVTAYNIYCNSVLMRSVSGSTLSYEATGLAANTSYTFNVRAVDNAGNVSKDSEKRKIIIIIGSIDYQYDANGRIKGIRLSNGKTINYVTDANGNIVNTILP